MRTSARPGYPEDAIRWLVGDAPADVVHLGAGTGKLTRGLAALGHRVTAVEPLAEMRADVAVDGAGQVWVAWEEGGLNWGKDTGFMLELAQSPQGTRLYEGRGLSVAIIEPGSNRILAPNTPAVRFESFNRTMHEQVEYPQLVLDDGGRMWLVMRRRAMLSISRRGVGRLFGWDVLASRFDAAAADW